MNRDRSTRAATSILMVLALGLGTGRADIFQWEYINPSDPSQGKQPSTTLCPDGAGAVAAPLARLGDKNLTQAYLFSADLSGASLVSTTLNDGYLRQTTLTNANLNSSTLAGADLRQANLTNADFSDSTLTDADLTDATVVGADFRDTTSRGFTKEQLYSTASYRNQDLSGIRLGGNALTGFLPGANALSGWNFAKQNLTKASFGSTTLTDADLTDAVVVGANFGSTRGFTQTQLYSTASYKNHDLAGIGLGMNDLTEWNFVGQNLTNAEFYYPVEVIQTAVPWVVFASARLTKTDLRGADTRGAWLAWSTAIVGNTILPDGLIQGLELAADQTLVVRDYDGNPAPYAVAFETGEYPEIWWGNIFGPPIPPIPIHVEDHFLMGPGGVLRMLFEEDAWDSTISFEPGIPVSLGSGTLELNFADDVNFTGQIGRTFDLFDWTGVAPRGEFEIVSPYFWDTSNLYSAGEVTFSGVPEPPSLTLLAVGLSALLLSRFITCCGGLPCVRKRFVA